MNNNPDTPRYMVIEAFDTHSLRPKHLVFDCAALTPVAEYPTADEAQDRADELNGA